MPGSIPLGEVPEQNPEPWPNEQVIPKQVRPLSNAEIADRLARLAQLLAAQNENPYKVKAYRRAAANVRAFSQSLDELSLEAVESILIQKALARAQGNITQAAEALGLSRGALYRRMEKYGL